EDLPPEPAPLRLAQAQGTRPDRARRLALRLPALTQGRPSRPALPLLPQAPVRPPRQQPLPPPAGPAIPPRQPARSRLSPRRCRHPTRRRSLGCSLIAAAPQWKCSTRFVYDPSGKNLKVHARLIEGASLPFIPRKCS